MKRILLAFSCVTILTSISFATTEAKQQMQEQAALVGILKEHPKWLFKYLIQPLGSGQEIALRGSHDVLKEIVPGSIIKVQGHLATMHHNGGTKENPSPFSAQWVVYMDVKNVEVMQAYEESQRVITSREWAIEIPTIQLDPFDSYLGGDIGGQYINEILKQKDITEVIVLKNNTQAPKEMYITMISNILRENPKIESLYQTDPNTGKSIPRGEPSKRGFFMALLKTKYNDYVGFELGYGDKTRVFTKNGDGVIAR